MDKRNQAAFTAHANRPVHQPAPKPPPAPPRLSDEIALGLTKVILASISVLAIIALVVALSWFAADSYL